MGIPIRYRLFQSYLAVTLTGMGLVAVMVWLAVEQSYVDSQSENLLAQAKLTAATLEDVILPNEPAQIYSQTANIQPGIHARILGEQGAVVIGLPMPVGNAQIQPPTAENNIFVTPTELIRRTEIQKSLIGEPATAVRSVPTAGNRRVLYAAAPIRSSNGEITGIVYYAMPLPAGGLPASLAWKFGGAILASILISGATATLLAQYIARPLETVANASLAVSEGNLNQEIPNNYDIHELTRLGHAFNKMTANLRQSEQAKNTFIADVTHELRTPLTVIKGTIETLEDGALDDTLGRGPLITAMKHETERLNRLVNDLLLLTRADAGVLRLKNVAFDLSELARNRCDNFNQLAGLRHGRLVVDCNLDPENCFVYGDKDRLAQVVDNLLDNAMRYSSEDTTVTVEIRKVGNFLECAVSDHGEGIPAEHLPKIFERFYRIETSRSRSEGGAGLGLAIARALVEAHGGQIRAQSIPGQGTVITFCLPLTKTAT